MLLSSYRLLVVVAAICHTVPAIKVLFMPVSTGHMLQHGAVAREFIRQGHRAFMSKHRNAPIPSQLDGSGIEYIQYQKADSVHAFLSSKTQERIGVFGQQSPLQFVSQVIELFGECCEEILTCDDWYREAEKQKFDFAVVDSLFLLRCQFALLHGLEIPYASLSHFYPLDPFYLTMQTNYISPYVSITMVEKSTFLSRLLSAVALTTFVSLYNWNQNHTLIRKHAGDMSVSKLHMNNKLWLLDRHYLTDSPKASYPNIVYLGGLLAENGRKLPNDFAEFADNSGQGLIIVSMGGSLIGSFPQVQVDRLLKALNAVEQNVIMRLDNKPSFPLRPGIKLVQWLPQNDLLAHRNTKLFITHCGMNSLHESLFHGVPMLAIPNQGEQESNAFHVKMQGYGQVLVRLTFEPKDLERNIKEILSNTTIIQNVQKASRIMKSRRYTPAEEAVYWILHVLEFGNEHLKPRTDHLYWFQIMMYDVMAAILVFVFVIVFVVWKLMGCVYRRCCRGKKLKTN